MNNRIERKRSIYIALVAAASFVLFIVGAYVFGRKLETTIANETPAAGAPEAPLADQGAMAYNRHLTTILFMGIDKSSQDEFAEAANRDGGQADFLMLLVIDPRGKEVTQLHIDRDTMAEVTTLGPMGNVTGTRQLQLCLAHAMGDGAEQSCELTVEAVERLLPGVKVNFYVAMNMDAIPRLNDSVGGVTVELEEDFSEIDPAMQQGRQLKLSGSQAEAYVRRRMDVGDGTNNARMARQRRYMSGFADALEAAIARDADTIGAIYDLLGDAITTNMRRGRMINEANSALGYKREKRISLEGEYGADEDGFIEFYADRQSLDALVTEIFLTKED